MKRNLLLLIIITVLGQFSCRKTSSCDGENTYAYPYYDIKGIKSMAYRQTSASREIIDNDTVTTSKFFLSISSQVNYYAARQKFQFFNCAMACDPLVNGYKGTKEILDSLIITSSFDFDSLHLKGSKLNDLFDYNIYGLKKTSLNEYLSNTTHPTPYEITLTLATKPSLSEQQKFIVSMYLSTGEKYFSETVTLKLK